MASSPPPDEALRRLGERLERASTAAERLITDAADEAAARIGGRVKPPPRGWQLPEEPGGQPAAADELVALLQAVRELVPTDLERRLTEALRELLLAVRALIDWYVERLDQRRAEPVQVQDIPVL
jgi:hypothetical protein